MRMKWPAACDSASDSDACARSSRTLRLGRVSENDQVTKQRTLGAGVYGRIGLHFYDAGVLGISSMLIWRCSSTRTLAHYQANVSANHLDVGVGTGYFLDRVTYPSTTPRLGLLDLNGNSLTHTARRLIRYSPEIYQADILQPIAVRAEPFDSIGLNYLLHCLPGPMASKAVVFDNLGPLLKPGGTIFGGTALRHGVRLPLQARAFMGVYNAMGIFGNSNDSLAGLRSELESRFDDVSIEVHGCVALFRARARP